MGRNADPVPSVPRTAARRAVPTLGGGMGGGRIAPPQATFKTCPIARLEQRLI